ncbi:tyrosine/serine phosphatase-like protein [Plenodomus tracheiphilus IPT5]|uniref:Tyrosine/serine phosphatase-like protein n=1 Tax=Plenodomus tracheiphilus IPT5 TaxID=1408161 RepID=A0A6A7BKH2_9PLEO|nr:tyrosine/serine phosphatase-like protein [Plenodomus tracheiphilus IPT5]
MADTCAPLRSILNFRDVGEFVNDAIGTKRLNCRLLYRSARPDEASSEDRQSLIDEYGIKSIIDLRTKTEHIEQAQKRNARIKASAALPKTNNALTEPLKIPGIIYHTINFNGSSFSRMLLAQLSWVEFFKLIGLMVLGYRKDAIKILSPHMEAMGVIKTRYANPRDSTLTCVYLVGLAESSLDVCTREVKQVFDVLSDEQNWPILVHCTQGKDRTGLIVMLVLFLLEIDDKIIEDDYRLSEAELAPEKEERLKEIGSIGLSERFAVCPPDVVSSVHSHVKDKYTSVEKYLESVGVRSDQVNFVKTKLFADSTGGGCDASTRRQRT